jgi:hypothetical protein
MRTYYDFIHAYEIYEGNINRLQNDSDDKTMSEFSFSLLQKVANLLFGHDSLSGNTSVDDEIDVEVDAGADDHDVDNPHEVAADNISWLCDVRNFPVNGDGAHNDARPVSLCGVNISFITIKRIINVDMDFWSLCMKDWLHETFPGDDSYLVTEPSFISSSAVLNT